MKHLVTLFLFIVVSVIPKNGTISYSETYEIRVGHSITYEGLTFCLEAVTSDSRCPKEVTCVHAGEALAHIKIFEKGKQNIKRVVTFTPTTSSPGVLYSCDDFTIMAVELSPYPKPHQNIDFNNYVLKVLVKSNEF